MSLPRQILPGTSYLLTRRCTQQQFLLLPTPQTRAVFLYCLAVAQMVTQVKLHVVVVMSNHYHIVLTDPFGRLPEFLHILNRFVARCLNAFYGRRENLWAAGVQTSCVRLADDDALLHQSAYAIANPVEAGLVSRSELWPGLLCWRPGKLEAKRPTAFFRQKNSRLPAEATVELEPLPFSDRPRAQEATRRVGAAVAEREAALRAKLKAEGRRFGTVADLRALRHTQEPATKAPRRGISPRVATRDRDLRRSILLALRAFTIEYRAALTRWRAGDRSVRFPAGTYKMVREHGAPCAAAC